MIEKMGSVLKHRGPDQHDTSIISSVAARQYESEGWY